MKWAGYVASIGEARNAYKILVAKHEGKKPLGRLEDNIRMDLGETGWGMWTGCMWLRIWTNGGHL
jgi:hypothetical protein